MSFSEIPGSSLEKLVGKGMELTGNLSKVWALSGFDGKRKLRTFVFPVGIYTTSKKTLFELPESNSFSHQYPVCQLP